MKTILWRYMAAGAVGLIVAGLNLTVQAQPLIQGTIDFDGAATLNAPLGSATNFASFSGPAGSNPIVINGDQTLDYSTVPGGTPASFTPFTFNGPQTLPFTLWTFIVGSTTYSFVVNTISNVYQSSNFLDLMGTGTAQITGFSDTPGTWTITDTSANPNTVHVTFSSSIEVVPEPTTFGCFLFGLGALACFQRFNSSRYS